MSDHEEEVLDRIGYYIDSGLPELSIRLQVFTCDKDGRIFLSPKCAHPNEIDCYIDDLHKQLEKVRTEGKKALSKAREKQRREGYK